MSPLKVQLLSRDEIEQIHAAALEVLGECGVQVLLPEARELLESAGAQPGPNNLMRIPSSLVERAVASSPGAISIYNRKGEQAMRLEGGNTHYGTGPTVPMIRDFETGQRRETGTEDIKKAAKLCDALPNLDFVMSMGLSGGGNPRAMGLDPDFTDRLDFAAMLGQTTKPLIYSAWSLNGLKDIHAMCSAAAGDEAALRRKPFAIHFAEPTSPLIHTSSSLQKLLYCAEHHIPLAYVGGPLMGGTAPASVAGQLVLSNVECLSGLVIHQLHSPGAPYIYGAGSNPLDMKTTICTYAGPDFHLSHMASKELSDYYDLPDFSIGGASDAMVLDGQAALEAGFSLMQAEFIGSNLVHDTGYMESGNLASWELMTLADEIIGELRHMKRGFAIDAEHMAAELIQKTGPGGSYLSHPHTFQHFREIWYPSLRNRERFDTWQKQGEPSLAQKLKDRVSQLLGSHQAEPLDPEALAKIRAILGEAGRGVI